MKKKILKQIFCAEIRMNRGRQRVAEYIDTEHHSIELRTDVSIEHLLMSMRARDLPGSGEIETTLYLFLKGMK